MTFKIFNEQKTQIATIRASCIDAATDKYFDPNATNDSDIEFDCVSDHMTIVDVYEGNNAKHDAGTYYVVETSHENLVKNA